MFITFKISFNVYLAGGHLYTYGKNDHEKLGFKGDNGMRIKKILQ